MGFFKTLGKILNPVPSVVKAIQTAKSPGDVVGAILNPAGSVIRDVTGESDIRLSAAYKAQQAGLSSLSQSEVDKLLKDALYSNLTAPGAADAPAPAAKTQTVLFIIGGLFLVGMLLLIKRSKR